MLRSLARSATIACVGLLLFAPALEATELRIQLRASDGGPVSFESAELLLVAWGDTERIRLAVTVDSGAAVIHVPLDAEWLRSKWPRANDVESAFIYIKGRNFVSLRSDSLSWIGSPGGPGGTPRTDVTISFGQGQEITVRDGETPTIMLNVRSSPEARQLKFIDDQGRPATDVEVSAYMFWSNSNHCGALAGKETLVERVRATSAGIVTLPDGDFPYAIDVSSGRHAIVRDPNLETNGIVVTYLKESERVIRIHHFARQPLSLRVFVGTQPVRSPVFTAAIAGDGCGIRTGELFDWTDDGKFKAPAVRPDGELIVSEFYPEEMDAICLGDEDGNTIWTLDKFDGTPVTVRLPADVKLGFARTCPGF